MPQGDKRKYTDKQKRKAEHIAEGYMERGKSEDEAKSRAWRTVNKESHGGEIRGGSGWGKPESHESSKRGGKISMAKRSSAQRSAAAKKAAATRKKKAAATHRKRSAAAKKAAKTRKRTG